MKAVNRAKLIFSARSENESLSRIFITAFLMPLNPTVEELSDMKTAVSEAVTNAVVHGYEENASGKVTLEATHFEGALLRVTVKDTGKGIEDVKKAMQPLYTTDAAHERSGMGFSIMETFCDKLKVISAPGKGTKVIMTKYIKSR